jgi:hypothetical protein
VLSAPAPADVSSLPDEPEAPDAPDGSTLPAVPELDGPSDSVDVPEAPSSDEAIDQVTIIIIEDPLPDVVPPSDPTAPTPDIPVEVSASDGQVHVVVADVDPTLDLNDPLASAESTPTPAAVEPSTRTVVAPDPFTPAGPTEAATAGQTRDRTLPSSLAASQPEEAGAISQSSTDAEPVATGQPADAGSAVPFGQVDQPSASVEPADPGSVTQSGESRGLVPSNTANRGGQAAAPTPEAAGVQSISDAQRSASAGPGSVSGARDPNAIDSTPERASIRVRVVSAVPQVPSGPSLPAISVLPAIVQGVSSIPARVIPSTGGPDLQLVVSGLLLAGVLGFGLRWLGRRRG